jgi:hypothetical protein
MPVNKCQVITAIKVALEGVVHKLGLCEHTTGKGTFLMKNYEDFMAQKQGGAIF